MIRNVTDKYYTTEELNALAVQAQNGNVKAAETIIRSNQAFIMHVAKRFGMLQKNMSSEYIDEILSAGNLGLWNSIRRYKAEKGSSFLRCAEFGIREALYNNSFAPHNGLYLPRAKVTLLNKVNKLINIEETNQNKDVKIKNVARKLSLTEEEVRQILSWNHKVTSFNKMVDDGTEEETALLDRWSFENYKKTDDRIINQEAKDVVNRVIDSLTLREQQVIKMHYGIGQEASSLTQIGEKYGITKQRAQQIEKDAFKKIKTGPYAEYFVEILAA